MNIINRIDNKYYSISRSVELCNNFHFIYVKYTCIITARVVHDPQTQRTTRSPTRNPISPINDMMSIGLIRNKIHELVAEPIYLSGDGNLSFHITCLEGNFDS